MASPNERLRYFDDEYLRAPDLDAEQAYHIRMRRRLNRTLGLAGVAEGLELIEDDQAGIAEVSVLPGMAIDGYGREVLVYAPYTLSEDDIVAARITRAGTYDVWIRYQRTASTPPEGGYAPCTGDEYTRWVEGYQVVLAPTRSLAAVDPDFEDPGSDDASQDQVGVLLGTVSVDPTSVSSQFSKPAADDRRVYTGVRAQRIRPPLDLTKAYDASPRITGEPIAPYAFLDLNEAAIPATSLALEANVFAEQNLVVGDDFAVDKGKLVPKPADPYPAPTGNQKIAGDLFLAGNLYQPAGDEWLALGELVKRLVPDVLVDKKQVTLTTPAAAGTHADAFTFPVLSQRLPAISTAAVTAAISQVKFRDDITDKATGVEVSVWASAAVDPITKNQVNVTVNWQIGPAVSAGGGAFANPLTDLWISFTVTCFP